MREWLGISCTNKQTTWNPQNAVVCPFLFQGNRDSEVRGCLACVGLAAFGEHWLPAQRHSWKQIFMQLFSNWGSQRQAGCSERGPGKDVYSQSAHWTDSRKLENVSFGDLLCVLVYGQHTYTETHAHTYTLLNKRKLFLNLAVWIVLERLLHNKKHLALQHQLHSVLPILWSTPVGPLDIMEALLIESGGSMTQFLPPETWGHPCLLAIAPSTNWQLYLLRKSQVHSPLSTSTLSS